MGDKLIKIITDNDVGINSASSNDFLFQRYGARGIIFNDIGEIAVFNKKNKNEFKLPGGGVEDDEMPKEAFIRECLEEIGCQVEICEKLGIIIEEKSLTKFKQISYVFVGHVIKDFKKLNLTNKEKEEGASLLWTSLDNAINLINNSMKDLKGSAYDDLYKSLFMVKRDYEILNYFINFKKKEREK